VSQTVLPVGRPESVNIISYGRPESVYIISYGQLNIIMCKPLSSPADSHHGIQPKRQGK
jgi:hypothetical protein